MIVTIKIKYSCEDNLMPLLTQYNSVLRVTYNRLFEKSLSTKEITSIQKSLSNVGLINSHLKNSAIYDAKAIVNKSKDKIIFGGKNLFIQRCQQKISHEEFIRKRLKPLSSVGEACKGGNRLFKLVDNKTILFKLNIHNHFILNLKSVGKKRSKELNQLIKLQNANQIPITYKLDLDYIYISFDYNAIKTYNYKIKENRVLAIDMNPNSIGWSIADWSENSYHIVKAGTISIKPLNDYRDFRAVSSNSDFNKYITNKRKHEIIHIAKDLFNTAKHFHCEVFATEKLNIKSSDKGIGRRFNRLCNNCWNRDLLIHQLRKYIDASSTTYIEVQPQYNSYIGNLVFRQEHLPDECLASIEIGRRGFEFATQYIFNRRLHKKAVIFPELELVKSQIVLSLEELDIDVPNFDSWIDILSAVKKSKVKYRFSTSEAQKWHKESLFSNFYKNRYIKIYIYL